jgi:hypothetical protein
VEKVQREGTANQNKSNTKQRERERQDIKMRITKMKLL